MSEQYFVHSGHPAGEIYHRTIFGPYTQEEATAVEAAVVEAAKTADNWLYGPHIYDFFRPDQVNDVAISATPEEAKTYLGI